MKKPAPFCKQCGKQLDPSDPNYRKKKYCNTKCMGDSYRHSPEDFWAKVRKTDTCWLYEGTISFEGYGYVNKNSGPRRKQYQAHRYAWMLLGKELPTGKLCLLHKCDVRNCVNPDHLYVGDRIDNARDMWVRRRVKTKLTPEQVLEIRAAFVGITGKAPHGMNVRLAKKYGVSDKTIIYIRNKPNKWRHAQDTVGLQPPAASGSGPNKEQP